MTLPRLESIINFLKISDHIATARQPTVEQLGYIKSAGYDVVINLAMPTSTNFLPNEAEIVAAWDMTYIHIPVVFDSPTIKDLDKFFQIMDKYPDKKIFIHCAMNWRVSCFIFLYRILKQSVTCKIAQEVLLKIWEPNEVWKNFIETALVQLR